MTRVRQRDIAVAVNAAIRGQRARDHGLGAGGHLSSGFAVGYAVGPQRPSRPFGLDLRGGPAFIVAVIPLAEVRVDDGVLVSGEAAGFAGALQR